MGATTTSNFTGLLTESYSRERVLLPFERRDAKFHSMTQEWPNQAPLGKGKTWPIQTKDPHSAGAASESSGVVPTVRQPTILQPNVDAVQVVAATQWSEMMLSAGRGDGSIGPDVMEMQLSATVRNAITCLNSLSLGHGTGRLAKTETTVNSADQIMANPEGVKQLRVNMLVDIYNADTSGAKQGNSLTINAINSDTRTVTFSASLNGTAGWGLYRALTSSVTTYGTAPFGLRAWADDGSLTSAIAGLTRSSDTGINANVIKAAAGTYAYSEKLIRKAINRAVDRCGIEPDTAICNIGIVSEHINHMVQDRILSVVGDSVPSYRAGYDPEKIGIQIGGKFIKYTVDRDYPGREIVFFPKSIFRRHQLRPLNWLADDSGIDGLAKAVLMQVPASGGSYALEKVAVLLGMVNYGCLMPAAIVSVQTIADEEVCGDAV